MVKVVRGGAGADSATVTVLKSVTSSSNLHQLIVCLLEPMIEIESESVAIGGQYCKNWKR